MVLIVLVIFIIIGIFIGGYFLVVADDKNINHEHKF